MSADNSQIEPDALSAAPTGKTPKVRTLKEPPEIWDLVHETRVEFKPGSAFAGHLKALHPVALALLLLIAGGGGVFGFMKLRGWSDSRSTTPTVPAETSNSRTVLSPQPAPVNRSELAMEQSTEKATAPSDTIDEPRTAVAAPPSSTETKVSAASPENKATVKPRPQNSTSPTSAVGETVATRDKDRAQASKLATTRNSTTVRTDKKDVNQVVTTIGPKSDTQAAAPTITKKEPDKVLSPQLIAPAKASSTPKPKVIAWP